MPNSSAVLLIGFFSILTALASIGEKRTILTSGNKVYTIHYQLGQSTTLYFGSKPETVICGNENYFHISKIREGITIQPVANISTNLTVLTEGKRFLFYLTPSSDDRPDTFIDVHWVPSEDVEPVQKGQSVRELRGQIRLAELQVQLLREITSDRRTILEFSIKNAGAVAIKPSALEIGAGQVDGSNQGVAVFEKDEIPPGGFVKGRLIFTGKRKGLFMKYRGKTGKGATY